MLKIVPDPPPIASFVIPRVVPSRRPRPALFSCYSPYVPLNPKSRKRLRSSGHRTLIRS